MLDGSPLALAVVGAVILALLWIDLKLFARDREPTFREGVVWSLGWLALSLAVALPILVLNGPDDAVVYTTVYLIERSLSLDNLFVFLVLFAYFAVPAKHRARLLFVGILLALVMRGVAILGGVALIEQFHFVVYLLGATLLVLAYRIFTADDESFDPERNLFVRGVRKLFPVTTDFHDGKWFVRLSGRLYITPMVLCLAGVVFADIVFAIDSIPAAFAITRDPFLIWMGNVFALLGLRALFAVVDNMMRRFRYLNETLAIVLAAVGLKLLAEDLYEVGPLVSLAVVAVLLTGGVLASLWADRRDARAAR